MRKRYFHSICLILMMAPLAAFGQTEGTSHIREQRPNLIGGELGGRAIIYSLNYEYFATPRVGLGAGLMGFGVESGGVFLVPIYVSFTPIGNIHSLYLSGGFTWAAASDWTEVESTGYGTAVIGYLYHSESGFFVRPAFDLLFRDEGFLVLPAIALGGSF